jgi:hypothetical protein
MDLVIDRCREVGAHALFMPSIRTGDDMMSTRDTKLVHAREQDLVDLAQRKGFAILLPAAATSLSSDFGFNTGYHLNDAGVAAMEDILAAALTRAMRETPPAPPPR